MCATGIIKLPDSSVNLQISADGQLRHLLDIHSLTPELMQQILQKTAEFVQLDHQSMKPLPLLQGKTVANLFFENSTRTRTTFELAAKRLSADVLNINIATSATAKGESLLDTVKNLAAMQCDLFVLRHASSGAAYFLAQHIGAQNRIINAGDGCHAHPTQALLDMFTIQQHKSSFTDLTVTIVGDILHSRVARSQLEALKLLGVPDIRIVAPRTLLPYDVTTLDVNTYTNLNEGIRDSDVIIILRLQKERMLGAYLPDEQEYFQYYGLTQKHLALAKPDVIIMHPGPANRGVEIESQVADGPNSVILEQVKNGIAVRMAVMSMLMAN